MHPSYFHEKYHMTTICPYYVLTNRYDLKNSNRIISDYIDSGAEEMVRIREFLRPYEEELREQGIEIDQIARCKPELLEQAVEDEEIVPYLAVFAQKISLLENLTIFPYQLNNVAVIQFIVEKNTLYQILVDDTGERIFDEQVFIDTANTSDSTRLCQFHDYLEKNLDFVTLPRILKDHHKALLELLKNLELHAIEYRQSALFMNGIHINMRRVCQMVSFAIETAQLTPSVFEKILNEITMTSKTLPDVRCSTIDKRKVTAEPSKSEYLANNQVLFYTNAPYNEQEKGSFGAIKRGYSPFNPQEPTFAIKKVGVENLAQKEVRYHRLLGRESFFFKALKGKDKVVYTWQTGKPLHLFAKEELIQIALEKRLKCLVLALSELDILHEHQQVHGDIKCQNIILNTEQLTLRLIDFGNSNSNDSFSYLATIEYMQQTQFFEKYQQHYSIDIYAMGIVTAFLFPELYLVAKERGQYKPKIIKEDRSDLEDAIIHLVNAMMLADDKARCTSKDALHYCNKILEGIPHLNKTLIAAILNTTINHPATIEDIVRGKTFILK